MPMKFLKPRNLLLAALLLPALSLAQADREPIDRIVALVEDDVITQSELDQSVAMIQAQASAAGERLPPREAMEEQVLERLIRQRLQVLRARDTGIRVSDSDVDQALQQVARQNRMDVGQLRQAIESDGVDFEEFRSDIRNEIITTRLRQRVAGSMDEISDTEVDIMLASDRFGGEEYNLSQILVTVPESASPAEVEQARDQIEDVAERLRDGLDFTTAAITFSEGPDALEGGEIGWRNLSALPRQFAETIEQTPVGEVTEPFRTPAGFVILKVADKREPSEVIVREYRARHLMAEATELVSPEQARDRIHAYHERLLDGEDFGELARAHSTDESTANLGGLMNWFPSGQYGPEIQQVIDQMEPGELSEPFQTSMGWHIIRLDEIREADRTTESRRAEAREMLREQKAEEEVDRFLRQLRSEAFVEVRL